MKLRRICILVVLIACLGSNCLAQETPVTDSILEIPPETMPDLSPAENNFDTIPSYANPFFVRKVPDSALNKLKNDEDYWYANLAPQKKEDVKENANQASSGSTWFSTLAWIIIIGSFVAVLIWYLASSNIRLFRRKSVVINSDEDEEITEDIFEINYEKEIRLAIAAQNYRLATRLMYLLTLKELADREIIQYKHERTNSDYLFQLSDTKYYRDFFRLTREFEYTWYGKFQLSPESFEVVQRDFSSFKQQMA